ncbi:aconitate hydratase AcnA [candidate division KSB1 bacterium]|nr:aconitate hydratase AcnA [candidate division KSB1 bacterium]
MANKNPFNARMKFTTETGEVNYYSLSKLEQDGIGKVSRLPFSIKIVLESLLRNCDDYVVTKDHVAALASWQATSPKKSEIPYKPARVIMQDFTGVPAVVDLAALRSAMARAGGDPKKINPIVPVDLVIDHSVQVDEFGHPSALRKNIELEFERNQERYEFLHWGQQAFDNFTVVPPASGIIHQVNLEYLGKVVQTKKENGETVAFPDTVVGTDSHTPMINGLGVVGWGVGGIEAEAVMLGQPIYMLIPEVIGFKLKGELQPGVTATDLTLTIVQKLREKGVVGKFVEYFGPGISSMSLPDRAMISNMAPEYGATIGFFPVDEESLRYMRLTGRPDSLISLVEKYTKEQDLFRTNDTPNPEFTDTLELDLSDVVPSIAGPKRPQDRIELSNAKEAFSESLQAPVEKRGFALSGDSLSSKAPVAIKNKKDELKHGSVTIASITSCTNTSNPSVLLGAGIVAKKAVELGLEVKPFVKTSLAPGSRVVTKYLDEAGLTPYLEKLGFHTVGYGCMTCIGNSGPLPEPVVEAITTGDLVVVGVVSGNRNFEGRIHQYVKANYLASPPLVVAYALAGTMDLDLTTEAIGTGKGGKAVYLKDIWPTKEEIDAVIDKAFNAEVFKEIYTGIEKSNEKWNAIPSAQSDIYEWDPESTYIQEPPFFLNFSPEIQPIEPIENLKVLVKVGDSITTDHISPASVISKDSPAGQFLIEKGIEQKDFNSYGSRRGNDRVMTRGTFANIRLKNQMAPGTEGGWTTHLPTNEVLSMYEASQKYLADDTSLMVLAGKEYGTGSSRDWAAKGTLLLGIKTVLAESFERIHRSNLVGMGVLPLQFKEGDSFASLGLTGQETLTIHIDDNLKPGQDVQVDIVDGANKKSITVTCRLDTPVEIDYYRNGGILHTVLRNFMK